ncbi:phage holin family protein [Methylolobus aquaticus]
MSLNGDAWGGVLTAAALSAAASIDLPDPSVPPGPWDYPLGTYLWVGWLSLWGASIRYLQTIKGDPRIFRVSVFLIELWAAPACGLIAFLLSEAAGGDRRLMWVSVILAGYAGKRFIERTLK